MKRLITICIALTLVILMFTGCAHNTTPQPQTPTTGEKDSTKPAATYESEVYGDPVYIEPNPDSLTGNVRFYTCFAGENGTDALIEEFNKYYPNINVEANVYKNNADGNVGLDTAMIAGEVDVILSFGVANTANRWANGLLMDLTELLKEDNLDLVDEWGTDAYTYNGRTYVFPSGGLSIFVAINMDKWEKAGFGELPTEWTWDEYLDVCRALTEYDSNGNVTVYGGTDFHQIDYWTYSIRQTKGKNVFYNDEGMSDFDNPLWKTVLQREVDIEAEQVWHSKATYLADSTKTRDKILHGEVASGIESILTRYITAAEPDFKIGYAPYPVNEKGETNYMHGAIPNSFVGVCDYSSDKEAAYAFAKFCATYGNKYMYAAGHAGTWKNVDHDEVLNVVFGSKAEAEKWIDTDSYIANVIAKGQPAYAEDYIVAFPEIQSLIEEYSKYVFFGEMTVDEALAEMKELADLAISDAS